MTVEVSWVSNTRSLQDAKILTGAEHRLAEQVLQHSQLSVGVGPSPPTHTLPGCFLCVEQFCAYWRVTRRVRGGGEPAGVDGSGAASALSHCPSAPPEQEATWKQLGPPPAILPCSQHTVKTPAPCRAAEGAAVQLWGARRAAPADKGQSCVWFSGTDRWGWGER